MLTSNFAWTAAAETPWRAGSARVNITPEKRMWMAGYGSRTEPAAGKLTELWAKALVLDDADGNRGVIITADLIGISRQQSQRVAEQLKQQFGVERHQLLINTSHTHSGPVVGSSLGPLHYWGVDRQQQALIDEYESVLLEKLVAVVGKAMEDLKPSRIQWGSGHESFAVNRRNNPAGEVLDWRSRGTLVGPVDHDVPVLSVRDADGKLSAVLFGYACHATVLSFQHWNGDYPGYAQAELEALHPECVAMFWAGCGGDQNPLPRRSVELSKKYGAELARAVDEVLAGLLPELPAQLAMSFAEVKVPLSQLPTRDELKADLPPEGTIGNYQQRWAQYLLAKIADEGELKPFYPYPVSVWTLGDVVDFVALGGEVVVDYAVRIKRERHGRRTWVAGYSHDVMAYIPSLRVLKEGGYEGGGSNVYYGLPSLWGDEVEETIIGAVHRLSATDPETTGHEQN